MSTPAISFDAPLQQATTVSVQPVDVSFDAPTSTATTVDLSQFKTPSGQLLAPGARVTSNGQSGVVSHQHPDSGKAVVNWDAQPANVSSTPSTTPAPQATISALPEPTSIAGKVERWAGNVAYDLEHGTDLTGVGSVLKAMGAHGLYNGNSQAVGDFMGSLPLGLLKATKGAAELPQSGKRIQGAKDVAGGALQAATIPSSFVSPEVAEVGGAGVSKAADAIGSVAGKAGGAVAEAGNAVRKPFSLKAVQEALQNSKDSVQQALQSNLQDIQDTWHGTVRDLFDQVAKESGVQPKPAESLRDVAANTAGAVKAKASAMYNQLDQAVGGTRFQTFDEQINNVKRALRNSAGIDPDADGRLIERVNALEDAKATALDQAKAAGVDPKLIDQANAAWRQASALEDLSKHVQASTSGLRGNLAQGVQAAQESLSPAKLATRANRMYNTGRLQQALGDDHADDLLKAIESTKQQAQDAAQNAVKQTEAATDTATQRAAAVRRNQVLSAAAAGSVGAGGAWAWLKHLIGE